MSAPAGGALAGKVAIVTGAATGIGKAIAAALGDAGADVVVNYLDRPDLAESVVAGIEEGGSRAIAVHADVSNGDGYEAMVDSTFEHFGRWDIVVNNAGIALIKPFVEVTEAEFDASFAVNVKGTFHGCQLAARRLADGGRIINISSSTTGLMLPGYGVYDATKGAIEALTHVISKELGPRRITINAVSPGATETETYRTDKSDDFLARVEAMSAFGRLGKPDEIASVVAFLASDQARWVTGQDIRVNGGTV